MNQSASRPKKKIVILGGGMAALTTAFELTNDPQWRQDFSEISIYQIGWRLGGKGASGRDRDVSDRIEEHGLHVWCGFYENAFQVMQQCYAELGRDPDEALSSWDKAFQPHDFIAVQEWVDDQWKTWPFHAPRTPSLPGQPSEIPSLWDYLRQATQLTLVWWSEFLKNLDRPIRETNREALHWAQSWVEHAAEFAEDLEEAVAETDGVAELVTTALAVYDQTQEALAAAMLPLIPVSDDARRHWIQLDFVLTATRGALRDRLPWKGFQTIDHLDFRVWLEKHGASGVTLNSGLLRGLYDFVFASRNADPLRQDLAAGVALRLVCRVTFDYKGAVMWKMRAGMGDVVFAPLYEVLQQRGVKFHFFHRVRNVALDASTGTIKRVELERQATLNQRYEPLIDVQGLPCWPKTPRYEFLAEGDELQKREIDLESAWTDWEPVEVYSLEIERDFDAAVLGISLAALPHVCKELIAADPLWKAMVHHVPTVQTTATQLWFLTSLEELGWRFPPPVLTAFAEPLETWGDFSQTLPRESWPSNQLPQCVAYLCGTLSDAPEIPPPGPSDFPQHQQRRVQEEALQWLHKAAATLWPDLFEADHVRWELFADPSGHDGVERFLAQYHRANVNPTDRYVQSPAGSTAHRISADRAWFAYLYICGDWTRTALNVGCIEAAVMSGLQAARAISNKPREIYGERQW